MLERTDEANTLAQCDAVRGGRQPSHLSSEERGVIFAEHSRGSSQQSIGRLLGCPASTICCVLARVGRGKAAIAPRRGGINEYTNGLLRKFMPKGTDLSVASQTWLNDVAALMNNRPRKTLGWRTPAEAMDDEIAASLSTVAREVGT